MQDRDSGLDIFRIICCVGVLVYHAVDDTFATTGTGFTAGIALYFLASFCVPGFFLMSGFLIGKRTSVDKEYIEKKILSIATKYGGWIVFWCLIYSVLLNQHLNPLEQYISGFASGGILPVAWFLFTYMVLLLLSYPLLELRKKYRIAFSLLCIVLLVSISLKNPVNEYFLSRNQALWIPLYLTYFVVGIWLNDVLSILRKYLNAPRFLLLLAAGVNLITLSIYFYFVLGSAEFLYPTTYYGRWYYSAWLITLFILVGAIRISNEKIRSVLAILADGTFAVYMLHLPLLNLLAKEIPINSTLKAITVIVGLFALCELLSCIFKKTPLLRKII